MSIAVLDNDSLNTIFCFLEVPDLCRAQLVCKAWNDFIKTSKIWEKFFEIEGIPLVIGTKEKPRNYREDFKTLYPMTFGRKKVACAFKNIFGLVPAISEQAFEQLKKPDPYDPSRSLQENYIFLLIPRFVFNNKSDHLEVYFMRKWAVGVRQKMVCGFEEAHFKIKSIFTMVSVCRSIKDITLTDSSALTIKDYSKEMGTKTMIPAIAVGKLGELKLDPKRVHDKHLYIRAAVALLIFSLFLTLYLETRK